MVARYLGKDYDFPVYEFKMLNKNLVDLKRYANGEWVSDYGQYDLAFIGVDDGAPMCYYVEIPYYRNIIWAWMESSKAIKSHPDNSPWHYMITGKNRLKTRNHDVHPNYIAGRKGMSIMAKRFGCANGRGVDFNINDPFIVKGLLRRYDTKENVTFPKVFKCKDCGDIELEIDVNNRCKRKV